MTKESHKRTMVKTFTWRLLATLTTMSLVLIFSGDMKIALFVGAFEVITKLIIYYLHERVWNYTKWGIRK